MDDHLPPLDEKNPRHSTGPISPEGKAKSSLNRLSHGCRSEQLLIPGEDAAEFDFLLDAWIAAYDPQDPIALHLVEETAKAHWFLKRNEKWLHQIHARLPRDAWLWTEENHKLLANTTRYKTTAERAFFRWYKSLETHYNRQFHRDQLADRARARAASFGIQWLNRQQELAADALKIDQFAHIFGDGDSCLTVVVPTNDEIKQTAASRPTPPQVVTRTLFFPNGVPSAYNWLQPNIVQGEFKTIGVQIMLYSDWLRLIEREQASATGHLGPAPSFQFLTLPPDSPYRVPA
jgi:hypothetical protein